MWWYFYAKRFWGDDLLVFVYSMWWCFHSWYVLMCKYQQHTEMFYVYVYVWIYSVDTKIEEELILLMINTYSHSWKASINEFSSEELKMKVCVGVIVFLWIHLLIIYPSLEPFFFFFLFFWSLAWPSFHLWSSLLFYLPSNTLISGHSALLFCSSRRKCQHETLNLRHNWTKSSTLECFYSWRKYFSPPLYCH